MPPLGCKDITFKYPGEPYPIFRHLDLHIDAPGFYALFGLSGAGKSTLAKIMARLLSPQGGYLLHGDGYRVLYSHNEERLPIWEDCLTHLESVVTSGMGGILQEYLALALNGVNLEVRFNELSLGQKNRVNLARYIVQRFDCLIMDEALANVDEPTRLAILAFLKRRFPDRIFIYVSHNVMEVVHFSKVIFCLSTPKDAMAVKVKAVTGLDRHSHQLDESKPLRQIGLTVLEAVSGG